MINHYTVKIGENTFPVEFFDFERIEKMHKPIWFWVDIDSAYAVADSEEAESDDKTLTCPRCREETVYEEGQIDESPTGGAIYGHWYTCYGCAISTQAVAGA